MHTVTLLFITTCKCIQLDSKHREISNSGHSELRTDSLQRTWLEVPKYLLPIVPIHCEPSQEDNLLTKAKEVVLKSPLFRDSTAHTFLTGTWWRSEG